jgi:hypothetical protein
MVMKPSEDRRKLLEGNLTFVADDLFAQLEQVDAGRDANRLSCQEQLAQIREFIDLAGEYGLAYESIVALLERYPFQLAGANVVKLLEVGLLLGFKTKRPEDQVFRNK